MFVALIIFVPSSLLGMIFERRFLCGRFKFNSQNFQNNTNEVSYYITESKAKPLIIFASEMRFRYLKS